MRRSIAIDTIMEQHRHGKILRSLGWIGVCIFWSLIFAGIFMVSTRMTSLDPAEVGMAIYATYTLVGMYWYIFTIPAFFFAFGLHRAGLRKEPLLAACIQWGTIATAVFLALIPIMFLIVL